MNFLRFGACGQQSWPPLCYLARCSLGLAATCGGFGLAYGHQFAALGRSSFVQTFALFALA